MWVLFFVLMAAVFGLEQLVLRAVYGTAPSTASAVGGSSIWAKLAPVAGVLGASTPIRALMGVAMGRVFQIGFGVFFTPKLVAAKLSVHAQNRDRIMAAYRAAKKAALAAFRLNRGSAPSVAVNVSSGTLAMLEAGRRARMLGKLNRAARASGWRNLQLVPRMVLPEVTQEAPLREQLVSAKKALKAAKEGGLENLGWFAQVVSDITCRMERRAKKLARRKEAAARKPLVVRERAAMVRTLARQQRRAVGSTRTVEQKATRRQRKLVATAVKAVTVQPKMVERKAGEGRWSWRHGWLYELPKESRRPVRRAARLELKGSSWETKCQAAARLRAADETSRRAKAAVLPVAKLVAVETARQEGEWLKWIVRQELPVVTARPSRWVVAQMGAAQ